MARPTPELLAFGHAEVERHRELCEEFVRDHPADPGVATSSLDLDGIAGESVSAAGADAERTVLYFHSGGYVAGTPAMARQMAGRLAVAASCEVLVPTYRLAPEHPFPSALDDAAAAYLAAVARYDTRRLVVGGASAGGGLALAILVMARDAGLPLPSAAFVLSPWADLSLSNLPDDSDHLSGPVLGSSAYLRFIAHCYLGQTESRHPLASPCFAELRGLPPLQIEASEGELLADDARRLNDSARTAGVPVHLELVHGDVHTVAHTQPDSPAGRRTLRRLVDHIRVQTSGSNGAA